MSQLLCATQIPDTKRQRHRWCAAPDCLHDLTALLGRGPDVSFRHCASISLAPSRWNQSVVVWRPF
jgi:hypothetical protein